MTVATAPPSAPSSFVQTRRECGVTSMYRPKNSMGFAAAGWPNTKRYVPPVRTSASQERKEMVVVGFFMGMGSLSFLASIGCLLLFQFLDNLVQLAEACGPEPAVPFDPGRLFVQSAQAELAGPHAPDLLRGDGARR